MKFDFEFARDQLNFTHHSLLLEASSSASCQHILTECIRSCTFMDTLPLTIASKPHWSNFNQDLCLSLAVDACAKKPCKNGGVCTNSGSSFKCRCAGGYSGNTCEIGIHLLSLFFHSLEIFNGT